MALMALAEQAERELRQERRKPAVNRRFVDVWCVFDHDGREPIESVIREAVRVGSSRKAETCGLGPPTLST